jgi:hypothetical protein
MAFYKFAAKLSHSSFNLMEKVQNFSHAALTGFWLGVMSDKSLDYSDELMYNLTKFYKDNKYNLSGLFEWEKPMIQKHFTNATNILLIAAGGGRETVALSKMGFKVDSYECNISLVQYANELLEKNSIEARIEYLPRNTVPREIKKYDGIIIGWGAYSFIPGRKRRLDFLSGLYPFLNKEAPMMISFLYTKKRTKSDKVITNVSNFFRFFSHRERTEPGDRLIPDFMHYFTEEEIREELIQCKYILKEFNTTSDGCLIATI